MTEAADDGRRRPLLWVAFAAAAAVIAWLVMAAVDRPSVPDFTADAPVVELPAAGELPPVDLRQFEGMVGGMRGRPVIVNIWASWCAPCRTETPLLQRASEQYGDQVTILGVASNDGAEDAADFMAEFGLTYPNVLDVTGAIRTELGLTGFPTTYLIDENGVLRDRITGGISEQRLVSMIEEGLR